MKEKLLKVKEAEDWLKQFKEFTYSETLIQDLLDMVKKRVWQPIDSAPKDGLKIIGYAWDFLRNKHDIEIIWYETNEEIIEFEGFTNGFRPKFIHEKRLWSDGGQYYTHWMPLPESPAAIESIKG